MTAASTTPSQFHTSAFRLFDGEDVTKKTRFILSGITSGNTRALTVPDIDGTILINEKLDSTDFNISDKVTIKEGGVDHNLLLNYDPNRHFLKNEINLDNLGDVDASSPVEYDAILWDTVTSKWKKGTTIAWNAGSIGAKYVGVRSAGNFRLYDVDNVLFVGFKAPANPGNVDWTLPANDGSSGQVLTTDGSGVLTWTDKSVAGGMGDMLMSVYDTDNDGIVDRAETVDDGTSGNSTTATEVRNAADKAHTQGTDQGLDIGGEHAITAAQAKEAYDRRGSYDSGLSTILMNI